VPGGEVFTSDQRNEIDKAIREAERVSGREFSVRVASSEGDSRRTAEALHAALPRPGNSILVFVDPIERRLEIVTGADVRHTLTNRQAALAAITMQTAFATGDLDRGLRSGLAQLARLSTPVTTLHTDTP
jgi:uncharacterized membrane protein YgcG